MAEHNALTGTSLHEPKNIAGAATSDTGKVITPSSSSAGTSELRQLVESEISNKTEYFSVTFVDISTAGSIYAVIPFSGTLTKVWTAIDGAITGGDAEFTISIDGTTVSPGTLTIANSGSAAGDIDSVTPTSSNTASEGSLLKIESNGGSTNAVDAIFSLKWSR